MRRPNRALVCTALAVAALLVGPFARSRPTLAPATIDGASLPLVEGCARLQRWTPDWAPAFVDPDFVLAESYRCDGLRLHVSIVQYVEQHQGKEAAGEFNSVIPRAWWNATLRQRRVVSKELAVEEYRVVRSEGPLTIWNWYAVGQRPTASLFGVKALEAWNALRFEAVPTTNITIAVEGGTPEEAAIALATGAGTIWTWFDLRGRT